MFLFIHSFDKHSHLNFIIRQAIFNFLYLIIILVVFICYSLININTKLNSQFSNVLFISSKPSITDNPNKIIAYTDVKYEFNKEDIIYQVDMYSFYNITDRRDMFYFDNPKKVQFSVPMFFFLVI